MPTKKELIDACLVEYRNDLDISRAEHRQQLESDTYAGVRHYYYYYRRGNQFLHGHKPRTIIRNGKVCRTKGVYKHPTRCGPRNYGE